MRTISYAALIVLAMLCIGTLIQFWTNCAPGRYQFLSAGSQIVYRLNTVTGQIDVYVATEKSGWVKRTLP